MNLLLLSVIVPVIIFPAVLYLSQKWRRVLMLLYIAGLLFLAFYLLSGVELGTYSLLPKNNLTLFSFSSHPYSKIAGFGFLFIGAIGLLYGLDVSKPGEQAVLLGAIGSAIGVCFADNFITFLFFWEILTLTTAAIVFLNRTPHAIRMAYRMLFFSLTSGFLLLVGIILQYNATGTFELMYPVAGLSFFIVGIGIKTAFLPLHFWVPWGYPAANFPCSVLLAALCTKVGVYAVARLLPPSNFIVMMGAVMAIYAVTVALLQNDLRRLLSYSIISKVGFMVCGVGIGIPLAIDGGFLFLVHHMLYKALLFMCAGALIYTVGTENFQKLQRYKNSPEKEGDVSPLWKALPVAFIGALVGALAISGTPPFNGYVGKHLIKHAVHGASPAASMLLTLASVATALCFCKFIYFGFIKAKGKVQRKLTFSMQTAIVVLSVSCLATGIWPQLLSVLLPYGSSLNVYSADGVITAFKLVGYGIVLFVLLAKLLEREVKLSLPVGIRLVMNDTFSITYGNALNLMGSLKESVYSFALKAVQRTDYKPGKSKLSRFFNICNFDFGVLMLMGVLSVALFFLFYLQFGVLGIGT